MLISSSENGWVSNWFGKRQDTGVCLLHTSESVELHWCPALFLVCELIGTKWQIQQNH